MTEAVGRSSSRPGNPDVTVAPHGIEPDLGSAAAGGRVPRPKARLADSHRAGCAGESRRAPHRSGLDRLGLKVKESQELTRFRVQCDPQTFAEKAKREAVRCSRDRHQTSGSSEVWHMPRCAMSRPCTENCLTNPSSSGRTYHERERSFRSKKVPDQRWVRCRLLGEHWQV